MYVNCWGRSTALQTHCTHTHTHTGFMEVLSSEGVEFTLVMLKEGVSSAMGGAVLGAKSAELSLSLDYSSNTTLLFYYKPYMTM